MTQKKTLKNKAQSRASSLNNDFNSDGGVCQMVTHNLEERGSFAKKYGQWLSDPDLEEDGGLLKNMFCK